MMLEEKIKKIEEAEKLAEKIVLEAKKQAEEIISNVHLEKEKLRVSIINEAQKEAEKIRLQAVSVAAKKEELFIEELKKKISAAQKKFNELKPEIVKDVISWIESWL